MSAAPENCNFAAGFYLLSLGDAVNNIFTSPGRKDEIFPAVFEPFFFIFTAGIKLPGTDFSRLRSLMAGNKN